MLLSAVTNGDVRGGLTDSEAAIFMRFGPNDLRSVSDTTGSVYKTKPRIITDCKLLVKDRHTLTVSLRKTGPSLFSM